MVDEIEEQLTERSRSVNAAIESVVTLGQVQLDRSLLRYDAWYLVLVAVILTLGATLLAGMAVWCVVNQHGSFTGHFKWENGAEVSMECER